MTLKRFIEKLMNSYAGARPGSLDEVDVYVCPYYMKKGKEFSYPAAVCGKREEPKVLECSQVGVYKGRYALFIGVPGKFEELDGLIGEMEDRTPEVLPEVYDPPLLEDRSDGEAQANP